MRAWGAEIPKEFWAFLKPRDTQIMPAELVVPICALLHLGKEVANRKVILFIDNAAGCHTIVKGGSSQHDLQFLATAFHITAMRLGLAWWIEWVPTACNASDDLSRLAPSKWVPNPGQLRLPKWLLKEHDLNTLRCLTEVDLEELFS